MNNKNTFDVIVIGVGSMGSSACYHLSKQGYKVLGLEQFDITHEFGSHAGQSRIIRQAYFEHPDYVPLLKRAYQNWKKLEKETGGQTRLPDGQVYFRTGLCYFGSPDHPIIKGIKLSAALYEIDIEELNAESSAKKFPHFKIPSHYECLYEPDAGFLTPEKAIKLYAQHAKKSGAEIHTQEKVIGWERKGTEIKVKTDKNNYHCKKLIMTAGAWSGRIVPELQNKLKVTRQLLAWVRVKKKNDFRLNNFPCWMIADDEKPGAYYGFPVLPTEKFGGPAGLKLAHHHPHEETDPDNVNREVTADDKTNLEYVLDKYLPGAFKSFSHSKVCLYTNTPDENFIIDKLPGDEDVVIACGFSGHGFKFVSVVGEILADLAIKGKTELPIDFLSAKRFQ